MHLGEFGTAARDDAPVVEVDTFVFHGETFAVRQKVSTMPLLKFADVAEQGAQAEEMAGLAAMYQLITSCVVPGDVARFERTATDNGSDSAELMEVCGALYRAVTGRPTRELSDSAGGLSTTSESSREPSSSEESSTLERGWRDSPFGRRELADHPDLYAEVVPLRQAATELSTAV